MSKSKVNAVLKAHGLDFIRYQSSDFHHKAPVVIDQFTKKRMKGIVCSTYGPLTTSNSYIERKDQKLQEVNEHMATEFKRLYVDNSGPWIIEENSKRMTVLDLDVRHLPTYERAEGLDAGYQQIVIVPQYRTVDK